MGLLTISCASVRSPSSDAVVSDSSSPLAEVPDTPEQKITLNPGDLSNIDKLLLQVNRSGSQNKELSLRLLENGIRLAEKDRKEGLHGERDGLPKLFCASAQGYPTVEGLIGCAESDIIHNGSLDVKLKRFRTASNIYRVTIEFARRINTPLSEAEQQRILDNIKCLDNFVKAPNPNYPGCELVEISLTKSPGIVKPNKTGVVY